MLTGTQLTILLCVPRYFCFTTNIKTFVFLNAVQYHMTGNAVVSQNLFRFNLSRFQCMPSR